MKKMLASSLDSVKDLVLLLEKERNIPQFLYIGPIAHRQVSVVRKSVLAFKKQNKGIDEIDLILQSPGGIPDDAYRIIRTFRKSFKDVNIIIPFWAKSAATLLALGGSTIVMNEFGEFGPLDAQMRVDDAEKPEPEVESALIDEQSLKRIEQKATELYHTMYLSSIDNSKVKINRTILSSQILTFVSDFYKPLLEKIDPMGIGKKRRYLNIGEQYAIRLLSKYNDNTSQVDVRRFIDYLVNECPDHGYVIDYDLVSLFLKNVIRSEDISDNYNKVLTQISQIFVNINVGQYVGFVSKKVNPLEKQKKTTVKIIKREVKNESKRTKKSK